MKFKDAYIPYGAYWSTPFAKWQGKLAGLNAIPFAATVARNAMESRNIKAEEIDNVVLGTTVPQHHSFYGGPWVAAMLGAEQATGTMVSQACATGARALAAAGSEIETTGDLLILAITADRCSNGPHIYYPNPAGPGGTGAKEDWVMDNFGHDPWAKNAMIQTAENVAGEAGISREDQEEVTMIRNRQYQDALADDAAFLKRFMIWPLEVKDAKGRKVLAVLEGDEGVFPTTKEGLAKLRPMVPEGTVTFGTQTFPADGNCGIFLTSKKRAASYSQDGSIPVQLISYGHSRVKKGFMALAPAPAARSALSEAGISLDEVKVIKTHNPFAVNDVQFARELKLDYERFNNYGSSLVYGHPQAPTGSRLIIETIEELALLGGGYGLFAGCAAGDTASAVVVKVG
jgi:acetyl-CoA acetyltransferase family protein